MSQLVITDLVLERFRKFDQPHRLTGLGPGLNLLSAPNEAGKSTLKMALDAALFQRHRVSGEGVKGYLNQWHDAPPVVRVEFALDGAAYGFTKRFYKQQKAILQRPDGTSIEGDAAERELQALLGFQVPERGAMKPELLGIWGLLWASQGDTIRPLDVSEAARTSLAECLVSGGVAAVSGGRRGQAVPAKVRDALAEHLTRGRGQPTGRYKQLLDERERLTAALSDAEALQVELAEQTRALLASRRDLTAEARVSEEAERETIRGLQGRLREAHQMAEQVENAGLAVKLAQQSLETAQHASKRRQEQVQVLAQQGKALAATLAEAAAVAEQVTAAAAAGEAAEAALLLAQQAAKTAKAEAEGLAKQRDRLERHSSLVREVDRLARALDAAQEVVTLRRQAEALACTADVLKRLRELAGARAEAAAARTGAATALRFSLTTEGAGTVRVEGQSLSPDAALDLLRPARLDLGALGSVEVVPRIQDAGALESRLKEAKTALADGLAAAGVTDLVGAETQADERARLLAAAASAVERAKTLVPDAASASDLTARLERARDEAASVADALVGVATVDADAQAEAEDAAGSRRIAAEEALITAQGRSGDARQANALAAQAAVHSSRRVADVQAAHTAAADGLKAARAAVADDALADAVTVAAQGLQQAEMAMADLQSKAETLGAPDRLQSQLERAEVGRDQRRQRVARLKETIARLEEQVRARSDQGPDEAVADAQQRLDRLASDLAQVEREKDALQLLDQVLTEAAQEAEALYLAPVTRHLRPYLDELLGQAELELTPQFTPTGLHRAARQESFLQLSAGTQEQLSILTRLAFADVLAAQGRPVVLLLDDALLYCDDVRLESMFTALERAAERFQVIIFTCHARAFDGLGGRAQRRLALEPADTIAL